MRSKAHWGYDARFMEAFALDLGLTPDLVAKTDTFVAEGDTGAGTPAAPLGFYVLSIEKGHPTLRDLWVEPRAMGRGVGAARFEHAETRGVESATSPSGRFALEIQRCGSGSAQWTYSRGIVRRAGASEAMAVVRRNFAHFPYSWSEAHPSGSSYLICGEDYQGQTVVDLESGERADFAPDEAKDGMGFCWTAHYPSPDGRLLFVDGCVWGAPYQIRVFDFERPMALPYPEIARLPDLDGTVGDVRGFVDGAFEFDASIDVRRSDGVPLSELDEASRDAVEVGPGAAERVGERTQRIRFDLASRVVTRRWIDPA